MGKILVAGASGSLGFEVMKILKNQGADVRALVSSKESEQKVRQYAGEVVIADARKQQELQPVLENVEIVFSSVGQSVSLYNDGTSFEEIDYGINRNLIEAAVNAGVRRFVYISIKGADSASEYKLAEVHKKVEDLLKQNDISYTVIRPVGFFSGFNDWLIMGKQGIIPVPGNGESKTNPIHQSDLARVVVDNLYDGPQLLEAGGPEIFTRMEIARMISEKTNGKIVNVPKIVVEPGLMFLKFIDDTAQAKLDYFNYVSTNDMIAPKYGQYSIRDYINNIDLNELPNG